MKYIRTKDGQILEVFNWEVDEEKQLIYFNTDKGYFDSKDLHPQKQHSDTIEELCDEFVVIGIFENQIGCCCDTFNEAKELKDYAELPQKQIIYGAIWTSKGLIYVAKMNEKGELELL